MIKGAKDPTGQEPTDQDDDELDPNAGNEDEESSDDGDQEEDHEPTGSDLEKMTPAQLIAENKRLRKENARKRQAIKDARVAASKAETEASKRRTDTETIATLRTTNSTLASKLQERVVLDEIRDYVEGNHPAYLKLVKRIRPFVSVTVKDDEELDEDSVRDKVKEAVEAFVKDVPLGADSGSQLDSGGRPIGGLNRTPSRGGSPDNEQKARVRKMFPAIYGQEPQG